MMLEWATDLIMRSTKVVQKADSCTDCYAKAKRSVKMRTEEENEKQIKYEWYELLMNITSLWTSQLRR